MNQNLNIHDIHKRLRGLKHSNLPIGNNYMIQENVKISIANNIPKDIMKSIEYCCKKSNPFMFESVLNLFDALYECENGTISQLNKMGAYICEEGAPKVRDSKETNTNLRRKLGRIKSKLTTKVNHAFEDAQKAVLGKVHAAQRNFHQNTQQISNNVKSGLGMNTEPNDAKTEAYIKCYENIIESLSKYEDCDRILENYDKISRRFNLEKLFIENTRTNGYQDTVHELCKFIETYDMPNIVKYNTVLETAWYGFEQTCSEYDMKGLVECATDHFLMKENGLADCTKILENTKIIPPEFMPADMVLLTELDPEDKTSDVFSMHKDIKDQMIGESSDIVLEDYNFNKIFSEYKKTEEASDETKLMTIARKLYTKNVTNIVDETPNFLNWIRLVFVLGTAAIHPVITVVIFIGDIFARLHFERDECEKMLRCFDSEIKKSETKMKSTTDPEEKDRLKKYIDALKKSHKKIDEYYEKMLSEKDLDKKYGLADDDDAGDSFGDIKNSIISDDDDDFDFNIDDWDDDFLESGALNTIDTIDNLTTDLPDYSNIGMDTITHMSIFNGDDIDALAKLSVMYPEVWAPELMEAAISKELYKIRKGKVTFENALERFQMINAYENARTVLKAYDPKNKKVSTIAESIYDFSCMIEAMEAINSIIYTHKNKNLMVEGSFLNSLKLSGIKLKKIMKKVSDKEKAISKNIDMTMNQFTKSVENSLTNENREAVIRGSVIPQASKIIKLAITSGLLWLVNPALSVITALGYLGLSSKHKGKERQLILDELENELKICEKYIEMAERKEDMRALKKLYAIQKNLQRQHQRIRYKMKVDFNQNVPSSTKGQRLR